MNKKIKLLIVSLMAIALLTACGTSINTSTTEAIPSNEKNDVSEETVSQIIEVNQIDQSNQFDDFINEFRDYLDAKNLDIGDAVPKDASAIGAISGYGFSINYIPFEMYLFNPNSNEPNSIENLDTAQNEGFITFFGVEINGKVVTSKCYVNQNAVLVFPTEDIVGPHPHHQEILDAFNSVSGGL